MALDPRLFSCVLETHGFLSVSVLRIDSLGSPARSLNFLPDYVFTIIAHKCFQGSHDANPSPHLQQQQGLPPKPAVPPCLLFYLLLVKDPPPPLVDLETKILGAPFTYMSQHFFVFPTILSLNTEVLCII